MNQISMNLLDNGLDYIYEAIHPIQEIFFNSSSRHEIFLNNSDSRHLYKYSILNLYSGIQLLLKERLKQEHWSLIFQDISNATQENLNNGNFVSVYHDELIKRLLNISKVKINDKPIIELRNLRNKFEHFQVKITISEYESVVASALEEVIKFWGKNLKDRVSPNQDKKFNIIKSIATGLEFYVNNRLNKFTGVIQEIIRNESGIVVSCPNCGADGFVIFKNEHENCKCFVCECKYERQKYLEKIREKEDKYEKSSFIPYHSYETICLACNKETRIRYIDSADLSLYLCLNCFKSEKVSKIEQSDNEFNEWVRNLEEIHTNDEVISILEDKLIEFGYTTREELNKKRKISLEKEIEKRKNNLN